jgi:hypothetical protein
MGKTAVSQRKWTPAERQYAESYSRIHGIDRQARRHLREHFNCTKDQLEGQLYRWKLRGLANQPVEKQTVVHDFNADKNSDKLTLRTYKTIRTEKDALDEAQVDTAIWEVEAGLEELVERIDKHVPKYAHRNRAGLRVKELIRQRGGEASGHF